MTPLEIDVPNLIKHKGILRDLLVNIYEEGIFIFSIYIRSRCVYVISPSRAINVWV